MTNLNMYVPPNLGFHKNCWMPMLTNMGILSDPKGGPSGPGALTLARPTAKRSSSRTALIKLSRYLPNSRDLLGSGWFKAYYAHNIP